MLLQAIGCVLIFLEQLLVKSTSKLREFEVWADPGKNPDDHLIHLPRGSRIQLCSNEVNAIHLVTLWDLVDVLNTSGYHLVCLHCWRLRHWDAELI